MSQNQAKIEEQIRLVEGRLVHARWVEADRAAAAVALD